MDLDLSPTSAIAILALVSFNFGIMLLLVWRLHPAEHGAAYWGVALLLQPARYGFVLASIHGFGWAGYVADILQGATLGFAVIGALAFSWRIEPWRLMSMVALCVAAVLIACRAVNPGFGGAPSSHGVSTVVLLWACGAIFFSSLRYERNGFSLALGMLFLVWGATWISVLRSETEFGVPGSLVFARAALQMAVTITVALLAQNRVMQRLRSEIDERARAERRFQDMAETASDWYWELDRAMRFTFVSPNIEAISGIPADAYIGKTREEVYGDEVKTPGWREFMKGFAEQRPIRNLRRQSINKRTGRPYIYTISGKPIFDASGNFSGYRGTGRDLTRLEEAEVALRAIAGGVGAAIGADYMRALTEHLARTLGADLAFVGRVEADRGMMRTLAFWCDGRIVDNAEYVVEGSPSAFLLQGNICVQSDGIIDRFPLDAPLRRRGIRGYVGAPLVDATGTPLGVLVLQSYQPLSNPEQMETVVRALAPRAAAELSRQISDEQLRASEHRFREVVDNMPIGFVLKRGNRFVMVNKTFAAWTGFSPQELEAMTDTEMRDRLGWPKHTQGAVAEGQRRVVEAGVANTWERQLVMAGGKPRTLLGVTFPVSGAGTTDRIIGSAMSDVTELRTLESSLLQAQKMDALGRLAGGIAHDFNNIVGAIAGYARFISEDTEPQSNPGKYAARIQAASDRAKDLIRQILAFSRRTELVRAPLRLSELIAEAANLLKVTLPVTTRLDLGTTDTTIEADATQMAQVLLNVCVNASDALGGEPGQVSLSVTEHDAIEAAMIVGRPEAVQQFKDGSSFYSVGSIAPDRRYASIAVRDTGSGMPSDVLARVFEPFFTTKSKGQGTGLGLPVVHGIVLAHAGAITIESRERYGTTFRIWLPIHEPATDRLSAEATAQGRAGPRGKGRILVIDDDDHFGDMVAICLERLGYEAAIVGNPVDAVATFSEDPAVWDLVLTDQTMPEQSGIETIRQIKNLRPELPCILCTGFSHPTTEDTARAAGADAYLMKPIDIPTLALVVSHLMTTKSQVGGTQGTGAAEGSR